MIRVLDIKYTLEDNISQVIQDGFTKLHVMNYEAINVETLKISRYSDNYLLEGTIRVWYKLT